MHLQATQRARTVQVFNLPHEQFCVEGPCRCTETVLHLPREGGVLPVPRRLCASLTLQPGETSGPLPDLAVRCPEIARALDLGLVRVVQGPGAATPATDP